jgi:hypothetical protein
MTLAAGNPANPAVHRDSYTEKLGKRFDRMDRGDADDRNCTNCLNAKVLPAAARNHFGIEMTVCAAGLWRDPKTGHGITTPLTNHIHGNVAQMRKRQDCPSFEASL